MQNIVKCAHIETPIFPRPNSISCGNLLCPELETGISEPLWGAHHVVQVVKIP